MINVVVPLAGRGQRMLDGGYAGPKALIMAGNRHIIDYGIESLCLTGCRLIFVVRRDHICNCSIDKVLARKFSNNARDLCFCVAEGDTRGAVETVALATGIIDTAEPLAIFCPDVYFRPRFDAGDESHFAADGHILTFKANSSNYSYVQKGADGFVTRTAEKLVISDDASVGVYCFRTGRAFMDMARDAMAGDAAKELYICPLYNRLIAAGGQVTTSAVGTMYIMGTPPEMTFFKDAIFPYFLPRSFIMCADHSGFECKREAARMAGGTGCEAIDCGCYVAADCDYAPYVDQAVEMRRWYPGGIILAFCRSGQGVNICANKHPGVRSAVVTSADEAELAIRHNAANCLAIPAGKVDEGALRGIMQAAATTMFEGGRHQNRLQGAATHENSASRCV